MSCCACSTRATASSARADALVHAQGAGGCVLNAIVLCEFAWTLARAYKRPRQEIAERLEALLAAPEFVVVNADEAVRALTRYRDGPADFSDYLLAEINRASGCVATATFDEAALKASDLFSPVPQMA
jgi:predicted nucleic-acid-binding protein